jgi:hypothetical protein
MNIRCRLGLHRYRWAWVRYLDGTHELRTCRDCERAWYAITVLGRVYWISYNAEKCGGEIFGEQEL